MLPEPLTSREQDVLALLVDGAIVVLGVAGIRVLAGLVFPLNVSLWTSLAVAAAILALLLILGRHITTPGEALFSTHYWHHSTVSP